MAPTGPLPLVGIPCDIREIAPHPFHAVGEKYINGVAHGARAIPLLIPGFGGGRDMAPLDELIDIDDLLDGLDGIFLPGSPSNVEPRLYGGHAPRPTTLLDVQRDVLSMPLIRRNAFAVVNHLHPQPIWRCANADLGLCRLGIIDNPKVNNFTFIIFF